MHLPRPKHSLVVAYAALFVALSGTAVAATGGTFILGNANSAGQPTALTNTGTGPALQLTNAHAGFPPLGVNKNSVLVPGLNANYVGGHPSSYFAPGGVLPSNTSESGLFAAGSGSEDVTAPGQGWIATAITYPRPLATAIPDDHIVEVNGVGPVTHCAGPGHAARGYLCFYDSVRSSIGQTSPWSDDAGPHFTTPSLGVLMYWAPTDVDSYVGGEWTVTAP